MPSPGGELSPCVELVARSTFLLAHDGGPVVRERNFPLNDPLTPLPFRLQVCAHDLVHLLLADL